MYDTDVPPTRVLGRYCFMMLDILGVHSDREMGIRLRIGTSRSV